MSRKSFIAEITPQKKHKYLNKLYCNKTIYKDFINNSPTEIHIYIPIPTQEHLIPNIQIWIQNGNGKVLIRFKDKQSLDKFLQKIQNTIMSDEFLTQYEYAEDISGTLQM